MFSIEVPQSEPAQSSPLPQAAPARLDNRVRVLVVDNDDAVMRGMHSLLEGWHCDVLAARNARDAEVLADGMQPDLLLLDYHLDAGDTGLALLERLRERVGEVPAIIISADHGEALRNAVAAAGCHLLHKPLKPLALKSLMARLLGSRRRGGS